MRYFNLFVLFFIISSICYSQDFKYIQPNLTDSTEVVKIEIDSIYESERIYYINYSKNSEDKRMLVSFEAGVNYQNDDIDFTYWSILKNIKNKPKKNNLNLQKKWIKLFKYKENWVLFDDIPKYELRDSCLIIFGMEDPFASIIKDVKIRENKIEFNILDYNSQDTNNNLESKVSIKIIEPEKSITLWRFEFEGEVNYEIMLPTNQVVNFPIMVLHQSELYGDETDIFDKIDYEKLWNE